MKVLTSADLSSMNGSIRSRCVADVADQDGQPGAHPVGVKVLGRPEEQLIGHGGPDG
jgi:hypothetical protein